MIGLSLEQANARLKDVDSLNDILDILKEIDISSCGKTTVLYSGIDRKIQPNLLLRKSAEYLKTKKLKNTSHYKAYN